MQNVWGVIKSCYTKGQNGDYCQGSPRNKTNRRYIYVYLCLYVYVYIYINTYQYLSIPVSISMAIYTTRFIIRNYLMWLYRLRSHTVCCLQAGDPEEYMVQFLSKSEGLRTSRAECFHVKTLISWTQGGIYTLSSFGSIQPSQQIGWEPLPPTHGKGKLLSQSYLFKC